ncbi:hypothetical protein AVEN_56385-1 [Araneus ventricosus]|uniref:Uncharacterized protein n=1 Tax=Araneus ventricosus TaxID=182803 RepID=A0A4Y2LAZ1_ARAVE|nr:hypothetical protein AVEN_56385-1 [Araneus ventricosus]
MEDLLSVKISILTYFIQGQLARRRYLKRQLSHRAFTTREDVLPNATGGRGGLVILGVKDTFTMPPWRLIVCAFVRICSKTNHQKSEVRPNVRSWGEVKFVPCSQRD